MKEALTLKEASEGTSEALPRVEPDKDCDLVMQGGIASGMVYPPAILELYRQGYRFHNIGGTSAGAIAAAFAAAAEHGRNIGTQGLTPEAWPRDPQRPKMLQNEGGFQRLQIVQNQIGAEHPQGQLSFLRNLFQPDDQTRALMSAAFAFTQKGAAAKVFALGKTLLGDLPAPTLLGTAGGAALWFAFRWAGGPPRTGPAQAAAALGLVAAGAGGALAGGAAGLWKKLTVTLPGKNFFGICSGHAPGKEAGREGVLTDWLAWVVDYLAGRCDEDGVPIVPWNSPLTFGDLAGSDPDNPAVVLKMVTSNLSQGQPYDLPFRDFLLLFNEQEMRRLFPPTIVKALIDGSNQPPAASTASAGKNPPPSPRQHVTPPAGYHFVPEWQNLPVAFAMRLSLSVPVFISAVPLYTVKAAALANLQPNGMKTLESEDLQQNWFSDGGLCSNFPIHFFDGWLPRWPTFGINLLSLYRDKNTDSGPGRASVPVRPTGGLQSPRHLGESSRMAVDAQRIPVRLPRADDPISAEWTKLTALFPFCFSVLTTAKDWQDTLAAQLPSYRERIVQVRLASDTGGMNLDMTSAQIQQIINLGTEAGEALKDYPVRHHKWVRYQVLMGQLEKQLQDMRETPAPPPRPIDFKLDYVTLGKEQLATENLPVNDPERFPYIRLDPWLAQTRAIMDELKDLIAGWQPDTFGSDSPLPEPTLRVTPDV